MRIFILTILFFSTLHSFAQRVDNLYSKDLRWRNVGPANMMGRIADIDALNTDYRQVICASASGGVFQSKNGGRRRRGAGKSRSFLKTRRNKSRRRKSRRSKKMI